MQPATNSACRSLYSVLSVQNKPVIHTQRSVFRGGFTFLSINSRERKNEDSHAYTDIFISLKPANKADMDHMNMRHVLTAGPFSTGEADGSGIPIPIKQSTTAKVHF